MSPIVTQLAVSRKALGMTQMAVASLAGVSLATLQNMEAGRANPSVDTLERVLAVLGLSLVYAPGPADWDALSELGLPLTSVRSGARQGSKEELLAQLRLALAEVGRTPEAGGRTDGDAERKLEALQALLLALRSQFPSFYSQHLACSPLARQCFPQSPTGRHIKLARIAASSLAEYL